MNTDAKTPYTGSALVIVCVSGETEKFRTTESSENTETSLF